MRIDHGYDRTGAELFVDEFQRGAGGLGCSQRVENDPAGITFDETDIREVEAAHLVDPPRQHFVEAIGHVENGLALQREVDTFKVLVLQQEAVAFHIPGDVSGVGHDLLERRHGDQAALVLIEVALVLEGGQRFLRSVAQFHSETRRHLTLGMEMLALQRAGIGYGRGARSVTRCMSCHAYKCRKSGNHSPPHTPPLGIFMSVPSLLPRCSASLLEASPTTRTSEALKPCPKKRGVIFFAEDNCCIIDLNQPFLPKHRSCIFKLGSKGEILASSRCFPLCP